MKKKLLIALVAVVLVVGVALAGASCYLVNFAIVRTDNPPDVSPESVVTDENASVIDVNRETIDAQTEAWLSGAEAERVEITSDDGLNLVGEMYRIDGSHKWLLGIHGYTSNKESFRNIAGFYAARGYNVLLPDMRAHGESEGTYIGMGWLDRMDVLKWIDTIVEIDPEAEIILHGVSMGGATVMMTSGEALPDNVKGIVEDCGYTSVWDIFADELDYLFGLPTFPLLNTAGFASKLLAGYDFTEASSVRQLANATVPVLFIHGSEDNFVRTDMVYEVYDACPTEKDILVVEGAGHGEAYLMDPDLYFDTVFGFLTDACGME